MASLIPHFKRAESLRYTHQSLAFKALNLTFLPVEELLSFQSSFRIQNLIFVQSSAFQVQASCQPGAKHLIDAFQMLSSGLAS